jgi:Amt family ammonium transporter
MGGVNGIFHGGSAFLLAIQLYGIVACAAWSGLASYILLKTVDVVLGLRVSSEGEEVGLDETLHGETCGGTQAERVAVVQTATPSEAALEAELA